MPSDVHIDVQKTVEKEKKIQRALEMKIERCQYPEIAKEIGVSLNTARSYVYRGLQSLAKERLERAEFLVDIELGELDAISRLTWHDARNGTFEQKAKAKDQLIRINESRRRLLGLDGAVKVDLDGSVSIKFETSDEGL